MVAQKLLQVLTSAHLSEKGQDLAEYSLFLGLIALVVVVSLTIIGGGINEVFTAIALAIQNGV